jgi:VWFA-related protein
LTIGSFREGGAVVLALAASFAVTLASQLAPPPTPTFRTDVEYVEVDALVSDEQGRFVSDLQKEDFRIFEDGKPQTIANFALVEIPVDPIEPQRSSGGDVVSPDVVSPDVVSNEQPFTGRIYTLILDDLHTAAMRAPLVKAAARQFIERHLAANDLMAVVHTGGRDEASQDFTSNKRLLLSAVDRFMGLKLESASLARNAELLRGGGARDRSPMDPFEIERGFKARSTTRALRSVAEWLGGIRGRRKTILFISEGIDYDITDPFNNRSATAIMDEMRSAIAAATQANASIYTIDPRGLAGVADEAIQVSIFGDQLPGTYSGDPDNPSQAQSRPGIGTRSLQNELRLAQDSLRTLAEETNGLAAVNSNDFGSAFERIVRDNSAYYVMAYYPPSNKRDGKFHRIEVRTSRPGLRVRARRGYAAPKWNSTDSRLVSSDGASPAVIRALNSPLPASGVTMQMFASSFKSTAPNTSVLFGIELRGRDLTLDGSKRIELSYVAVNPSGETRGSTDFFTLTLPQETRTRVQQTGVRVLRRFDLPPGRYQLRVAAHDIASGRVGSLQRDLEVPDYNRLPFSMSGLVLSSRAGTATPTARGDALLQRFMPAPPVALRVFPVEDELLVFGEIYDRASAAPHVVDLETRVRSSAGTVVFAHTEHRSSDELGGQTGGYGHLARIPMNGLAPGHYVLTVEARSRLGQTTSRHVPFEVAAP